jgi:hypothetical protein
VTALEIPTERHLQIQAAFRRHVDNSVSKTINLPQEATQDKSDFPGGTSEKVVKSSRLPGGASRLDMQTHGEGSVTAGKTRNAL